MARGLIYLAAVLDWFIRRGHERLKDALLDRLARHASILEMNGDSCRLAQSRAQKAKVPT